jgi:RES domain
MQRRARDVETLDLLTGLHRQKLELTVWRMVRAGRNPAVPSSPKGRWDDGSFEVLYTACKRDGACAELHYHLTFGQPVFPSQLRIHLHEFRLQVKLAYVFENLESLAPFGVDPQKYGSFDYARLQEEYSPTQKLGEACQFLGADALLVPNARWACQNAVLFAANMAHDALQPVADHGPIDLRTWARMNKR